MSNSLGKYNISSYIDDLVPDHVETSYPDLVNFLKTYALYLERSNESGFYLNSLDIQRDIDYVEEKLLTELQNEIGIAVPRDFATNPRTFYKHLIEFYRSRGTPESITSFFRVIYDDEVETYFPFVDILNPSDGNWTDQAAAIQADRTAFTPTNTITISGTPTEVTGNNDAGNPIFLDDDVVFVNNSFKTPGTDYTETVYSDTTTKYKLTFTTALANNDVVRTYPKGLFTNNDGFLSDKKFLQDSFYYQKFSYVLRTGANIADWSNAFTRLIHPAGFKFFGEIAILIKVLDQGNTQAQLGNQLPVGEISFNIGAFQVGPVSFNSHILEKSYTHFTNGSSELSKIGMQNHWDNNKFRYLGPNSDLAHWTLEDSINNNITTQFGMGGASSLVIS
nr:putative structural protein [uncultured Mediterranean phage uvMED]